MSLSALRGGKGCVVAVTSGMELAEIIGQVLDDSPTTVWQSYPHCYRVACHPNCYRVAHCYCVASPLRPCGNGGRKQGGGEAVESAGIPAESWVGKCSVGPPWRQPRGK